MTLQDSDVRKLPPYILKELVFFSPIRSAVDPCSRDFRPVSIPTLMALVCLAATSPGMPQSAGPWPKAGISLRLGCGVRPWFEKPPLLYWMTAAGTVSGLNPELASRLPVALLSLAFLAVSFWLLRREFDIEVAALSMSLLATSAGWMTYSGLCLTDLPLAVFFSLAVFLALPLLRDEPQIELIQRRFALIGVCLGLGMLAKGLVPLALCLPFLWFLRRFSTLLVACLCGLPDCRWSMVCGRLRAQRESVPSRFLMETPH